MNPRQAVVDSVADVAVAIFVAAAGAGDDSADRVDDRVADTEDTQTEDQPLSEDTRQLQELYDLMQAENLDSIELEDKDTKIRLQRGRPGDARRSSSTRDTHFVPAFHAPAAPAPEPETSEDAGQPIVTPLAGVFYRSSSPNSAPYVKEGSTVEPGQTLCIVEAMKVMNEIKAESRCRILKITAENSRPVKAGQTLFLVEPA